MYLNKNNIVCTVKGIRLIINTENGSVVGVDEKGLKQYHQMVRSDYQGEDDALYLFLMENKFVSEEPQKENSVAVTTAYFHITNKCNLHCLGCYSENSARNNKVDLSSEEVKHILEELGKSGIKNLVISGGEPLCRSDIVELVKYAKGNCGIESITIITNGMIFDKNIFEGLVEHVNTIAVSLDTYSADCHSFLRDEGIFTGILKTIKYMQDTGLRVSILPTIHHKNVKYMSKYIELATRIGTEISFSIFTTCKNEIYEEYILTQDDLDSLADHFSTYGISAEDIPINNTLEGKRHCGSGCNIISVGADGSLYPCHMLMEEKFKMGNLLEKSFNELLQKNHHQENCWESNVDQIEDCQLCEYKYLCGGGCRARSYLMEGDIRKGDPFCRMYQNFYEKLFVNLKKNLMR